MKAVWIILDCLLCDAAWYRTRRGGEWELVYMHDYSGWTQGQLAWVRKKTCVATRENPRPLVMR